MPTPNFLIGYGERLVDPINAPPSGGPKYPPYSFSEAQARVLTMVRRTAQDLGALPDLACPNGQAVAVLTLHPQYLAKSYFPSVLLRSVGLESLGSRPTQVKPEKWTRKGEPELSESTELFIAGPRDRVRQWAQSLPNWTEDAAGKQLTSVEQLRAQRRTDRLQPVKSRDRELPLEIVLHAHDNRASAFIIEGFEAFLKSLGLEADFDRRFHVGGLCFLPMQAPRSKMDQIADFSFLRVLREMPRLRMLNPIIRSVANTAFDCALPTGPAQNPGTRVAIFDGGLSPSSPLTRWVQSIDPPNIGAPVPDYLEHGHQVTSALLFGSLANGAQLNAPFTKADHYRVLDTASSTKRFELYDVLARIRNVLENQPYEFISLSIGPDMPVEDKEVHPWTAFFDDYLSTGNSMAAFAVGNGGENDRASGNARIQVPSDSVNGFSVGASTSTGSTWTRAGYSSIGPGRSPGVVKPDILCFGGTDAEPFFVVDPRSPNRTLATLGTSFATPAALQLGLGVRTCLGDIIKPLANKALLVHCARDHHGKRDEHGWGCIPHNLDELIISPDGTARILYQGELRPGKYVRAQIPVPFGGMSGMVNIRATFCYATRTDPEDPGNYTRSGLVVVFRPHNSDRKPGATYAKSSSFFQRHENSVEQELRRDAHKWETTLHAERRMQAAKLRDPVFDIHHNAREGGAASIGTVIRYALVVSVTSPGTADLYNKIVRRYATRLQPLQPVISIPIRT